MQPNDKKLYKGTDLVRDIMTTTPDFVFPSTKITDAAGNMRDLNVGSMPVVDQGRLVGIITDRDIAIRVTADGFSPEEVLVKDVMTQNLVTVRPDQTLDEAVELMRQNQIRRLPVVDNGNIVGMLSLGDLALDPTTQDEAAAALTDISEPSSLDQNRL